MTKILKALDILSSECDLIFEPTLNKQEPPLIWTIQKAVFRSVHFITGKIFKLIKVPVPDLLTGPGSVKKLPAIIQNNGLRHVLLVTDKGITSIGLINGLLEELEKTGIKVTYRFIEKVRDMNRNLEIPTSVAELQEKDIPMLAQRIVKEGNPDYPVPTLMNRTQCEGLLRALM